MPKSKRRDDSVRDHRQSKLVFSRKTAADKLDCSIATLIRMERAGLLTPIRLTGKKRGAVSYYAEQVSNLAREPEEAS